MCQVTGCEGKVVSNGLCDKHRKRLVRHGTLEATRPKRWGKKMNHPLYNRWYSFYRKQQIDGDWLDFWKFVDDIGEPPVDHILTRLDKTKPLSSENSFWKPIRQKRKDYESDAAYQREYRRLSPAISKNSDLKKSYGITIEYYNKMLEVQNGVCAICGNPETATIKGKVLSLSVDHCHVTGKIRGLLCNHCNHAIGKFKDNVSLLEKAIQYLNK